MRFFYVNPGAKGYILPGNGLLNNRVFLNSGAWAEYYRTD